MAIEAENISPCDATVPVQKRAGGVRAYLARTTMVTVRPREAFCDVP